MNNELLAMLEYFEQEKNLDKEVLFKIVEDALTLSAEKENPMALKPRVTIDRKTGEFTTYSLFVVVEEIGNSRNEKTLEEVLETHPEAEIEDVFEFEFSSSKTLTRVAAQATKQALTQQLRQIEKERVVEEFSEFEGELISGTVRYFEKGDVIVDFGTAEGALNKFDRISSEDYQPGDHITVLLREIDTLKAGPSLVVSRSHPNFIQKLFEREVTEIAEGIVEIKGIAREAGHRTKIAVHCDDSHIDPIGACVGLRGSRVKNIIREVNREKIDIVHWKEDLIDYIKESLKPAEIDVVELDEEEGKATVKARDDQYSLAIGRRGQNARLTAKLTELELDIVRLEEATDEDNFQARLRKATDLLTTLPHVDDIVAEELIGNGYLSIDGLSEADPDDLASIQGLDYDRALEIIQIAKSRD